MNIQKTTNSVNFNSRIVNTKYMQDVLQKSIEKPEGQRKIIRGIKRILNDGKNNTVEIDYMKNKIIQFIFPGAYEIKINGISKGWDYHFIGGGVKQQAKFALKEVFMDEAGQFHLPEYKPTESEAIVKIKQQLFILRDRMALASLQRDYKEYAKLDKQYESLRNKADRYTKQELINLKNKYFSS